MTAVDIHAFLKARLAEDEELARTADAEPIPDDGFERGTHIVYGLQSTGIGLDYQGFALVWDPARVLLEIAAKRAILAIHKMVTQVWTEDIGPTDDPYLTEAGEHGSGCAHCHDTGLGEIAPDGPCVTLKALASVWADHPDFDPAWSVTR